MKKIYITTPIYYPNDNLHIGHCYTTVICDVFKRFNTMIGNDCYFLTGSDEHGLKIERKAKKEGFSNKEYVDKIVLSFKNLWSKLNIDYDKFVRTTDVYHEETVAKIFEIFLDKKLIYMGIHEADYCDNCEESFTLSELIDETKCPNCKKITTKVKEESYFLKTSEFADWIKKELLNKNIILLPENRVKEIVNNFLENLKDLSVSRTNFNWGIKVLSNDKHVIYVWIDALCNYITALGYLQKDNSLFLKYWSEDTEIIHVIGKEITRFHSVYWPIILKSLDLRMPNKIISHGWIVSSDNEKMSKSKGNVIDPFSLIEITSNSDFLRYYLSKNIEIGKDFGFSLMNYKVVYNTDLANSLGNLISRFFTMVKKYNNNIIPKYNLDKEEDCFKTLRTKILNIKNSYEDKMSNMLYQEAIQEILEVIFDCNKLIEEYKPWELFKEKNTQMLNDLLNTIFIAINVSMKLLSPFLIETYKQYLALINSSNFNYKKVWKFSSWDNIQINDVKPFFVRLEINE